MAVVRCDLRGLASGWARSLPSGVDGEDDVVFSKTDVVAMPSALTTSALVIKRSHHNYDGHFHADALSIFATRQTYRDWGLFLVAHLLAASPKITEIDLAHPDSDITLIRVEPAGWSDGVLSMDPVSVAYWPTTRRRYPWVDGANALPPSFRLTTADELGGSTEKDWAGRDTVLGHGQGPAVAWLACLLLDLGNSAVGGDEFRLEVPDIGNGGTTAGSAEVTFWLPGSLGWLDFGLDNPA